MVLLLWALPDCLGWFSTLKWLALLSLYLAVRSSHTQELGQWNVSWVSSSRGPNGLPTWVCMSSIVAQYHILGWFKVTFNCWRTWLSQLNEFWHYFGHVAIWCEFGATGNDFFQSWAYSLTCLNVFNPFSLFLHVCMMLSLTNARISEKLSFVQELICHYQQVSKICGQRSHV